MDIRMPERWMVWRRPDGSPPTVRSGETRVLVLTTFELDEYVFRALRAGASGFLLKGGEPADLVQAIRIVARGERSWPRRHAKLIEKLRRAAQADRQDRAPTASTSSPRASARSSARRDRTDERREIADALQLAVDGEDARLADPHEARGTRRVQLVSSPTRAESSRCNCRTSWLARRRQRARGVRVGSLASTVGYGIPRVECSKRIADRRGEFLVFAVTPPRLTTAPEADQADR